MQGEVIVQKAVDRESPDMTLDAKARGVFSLDVTATDQAVPNNTRRSSTVRVNLAFLFNFVNPFYWLKILV